MDLNSVQVESIVRKILGEMTGGAKSACSDKVAKVAMLTSPKHIEVKEFPIDGTNHAVIVLRKVASTPKQYPRRFAKIKQSPL